MSLTNGSLLWDKGNGCMLQPNQGLLDWARRKNSPESADIPHLPPGLGVDE